VQRWVLPGAIGGRVRRHDHADESLEPEQFGELPPRLQVLLARGVASGSVLQKSGEERRYFYRFDNPLLQPYVILSGLAQNLIDEDLVRRAQERAERQDTAQTRLPVDTP
jgi:hypothetical protein